MFHIYFYIFEHIRYLIFHLLNAMIYIRYTGIWFQQVTDVLSTRRTLDSASTSTPSSTIPPSTRSSLARLSPGNPASRLQDPASSPRKVSASVPETTKVTPAPVWSAMFITMWRRTLTDCSWNDDTHHSERFTLSPYQVTNCIDLSDINGSLQYHSIAIRLL